MTVDPGTSTDIQTGLSDDTRPSARHAGHGLTREQFEAAMRVMDARSPSPPMAPPANPADNVAPASA